MFTRDGEDKGAHSGEGGNLDDSSQQRFRKRLDPTQVSMSRKKPIEKRIKLLVEPPEIKTRRISFSPSIDEHSNAKHDGICRNSKNEKVANVTSRQMQSSESPIDISRRTALPKKKPIWKKAMDTTSGRYYYYNRISRQTTWTKPRGKGCHKPTDSEQEAKGVEVNKTCYACVQYNFVSDEGTLAANKCSALQVMPSFERPFVTNQSEIEAGIMVETKSNDSQNPLISGISTLPERTKSFGEEMRSSAINALDFLFQTDETISVSHKGDIDKKEIGDDIVESETSGMEMTLRSSLKVISRSESPAEATSQNGKRLRSTAKMFRRSCMRVRNMRLSAGRKNKFRAPKLWKTKRSSEERQIFGGPAGHVKVLNSTERLTLEESAIVANASDNVVSKGTAIITLRPYQSKEHELSSMIDGTVSAQHALIADKANCSGSGQEQGGQRSNNNIERQSIHNRLSAGNDLPRKAWAGDASENKRGDICDLRLLVGSTSSNTSIRLIPLHGDDEATASAPRERSDSRSGGVAGKGFDEEDTKELIRPDLPTNASAGAKSVVHLPELNSSDHENTTKGNVSNGVYTAIPCTRNEEKGTHQPLRSSYEESSHFPLQGRALTRMQMNACDASPGGTGAKNGGSGKLSKNSDQRCSQIDPKHSISSDALLCLASSSGNDDCGEVVEVTLEDSMPALEESICRTSTSVRQSRSRRVTRGARKFIRLHSPFSKRTRTSGTPLKLNVSQLNPRHSQPQTPAQCLIVKPETTLGHVLSISRKETYAELAEVSGLNGVNESIHRKGHTGGDDDRSIIKNVEDGVSVSYEDHFIFFGGKPAVSYAEGSQDERMEIDSKHEQVELTLDVPGCAKKKEEGDGVWVIYDDHHLMQTMNELDMGDFRPAEEERDGVSVTYDDHYKRTKGELEVCCVENGQDESTADRKREHLVLSADVADWTNKNEDTDCVSVSDEESIGMLKEKHDMVMSKQTDGAGVLDEQIERGIKATCENVMLTASFSTPPDSPAVTQDAEPSEESCSTTDDKSMDNATIKCEKFGHVAETTESSFQPNNVNQKESSESIQFLAQKSYELASENSIAALSERIIHEYNKSPRTDNSCPSFSVCLPLCNNEQITPEPDPSLCGDSSNNEPKGNVWHADSVGSHHTDTVEDRSYTGSEMQTSQAQESQIQHLLARIASELQKTTTLASEIQTAESIELTNQTNEIERKVEDDREGAGLPNHDELHVDQLNSDHPGLVSRASLDGSRRSFQKLASNSSHDESDVGHTSLDAPSPAPEKHLSQKEKYRLKTSEDDRRSFATKARSLIQFTRSLSIVMGKKRTSSSAVNFFRGRAHSAYVESAVSLEDKSAAESKTLSKSIPLPSDSAWSDNPKASHMTHSIDRGGESSHAHHNEGDRSMQDVQSMNGSRGFSSHQDNEQHIRQETDLADYEELTLSKSQTENLETASEGTASQDSLAEHQLSIILSVKLPVTPKSLNSSCQSSEVLVGQRSVQMENLHSSCQMGDQCKMQGGGFAIPDPAAERQDNSCFMCISEAVFESDGSDNSSFSEASLDCTVDAPAPPRLNKYTSHSSSTFETDSFTYSDDTETSGKTSERSNQNSQLNGAPSNIFHSSLVAVLDGSEGH